MPSSSSRQKKQAGSLLNSFQVLDLSNETGFLCGKLLADLGAEVIKIERPGGEPARRMGPFYQNLPDPEKSLSWWAFNGNKKGITLDIEHSRGQELFRRLARDCDLIVESYPPGYLRKINLGYEELKKINPALIMTSITPFGQSGPYAGWKGSNLIAEAMGGSMHITGNPDERPLSTPFGYAYLHAGIQAAAASLMAHYWRERTGEGQQIDLSIQEAVLITLYNAQMLWDDSRIIQGRYGGKLLRHQKVVGGLIFPCKDGYIMWRLMTAEFAPRLIPLIEWMEEEGAAGELSQVDWIAFDMSKITQEQQDSWEEIFTRFFLSKTKKELYAETVKRGMMIFPINDVKETLEDPQLEARRFWQKVEHQDVGASLTYPGVPFKIHGFSYELRRAPRIGEDNEEIYIRKLGLSRAELVSLQETGVI